jgi:flagellar hook protein FlgE
MPFRIALSGLNAASNELRVIGNNVANASTTGFKLSRAEFADVFPANNLGAASNGIGSGVKIASISQQFTQGNIDFTNNNLDLAVSGQGFFRLSDNGETLYTRAGSFGVNDDGYVVNAVNQRLTAYQAGPSGEITGALTDMRIDTADISPNATTMVEVTANLDANVNSFPVYPGGNLFNRLDPTTYNNSTSSTVYDSLGNPLVATMYYRKTDTPNTWETHLWLTNGSGLASEVVPDGAVAGQPASLVFNADGSIATVTPPLGTTKSVNYQVTSPGTGAANLDIAIDYSTTTQYGSGFGVNALRQDGYTSGQLTGIGIDGTGMVQARYSNGQTRGMGQVVLANFSNPQGLQQMSDTSWAETFTSGPALVGAPGASGLGLIQSGALEGSNVDLTEQLVNMITAQRNFQANAQVITTADTITQTIINIRR